MSTIRPKRDERYHHSDAVPIRLLSAEQIEAARHRPVGSPDARADQVREILARSTFTVPPQSGPRPVWYR
ncbi:hypothetical protein ACLBWP_05570 [Microbacterium sp. M1A1_1b]|uniref:hypothetical protein n=1 Tax=Curtobacterium sp. VKM Ac-2922 TaxID=2929475 RepID=UPI001FB40F9C|nr:hypothetical protein [Curtobacterium sp. VKM Ac-2922]MCJ1714259.1 hypothetical protein [Curtobacterium sp. VKM Ac-2922]